MNSEKFWDAEDNHKRVKQYQIVKYLTSIDDGWIYRKGRYYRGAMQSEDEETWGKDYFSTILSDNSIIDVRFLSFKRISKRHSSFWGFKYGTAYAEPIEGVGGGTS